MRSGQPEENAVNFKIVSKSILIMSLGFCPLHSETVGADVNNGFQRPVGGIGITLEGQENIFVSSVIPEGSAWRSGQIEVGDEVVSISRDGRDFESVTGYSKAEVANLLRGEIGSLVWLHIKKPGGDFQEISLSREALPPHEGVTRNDSANDGSDPAAECEFVNDLRASKSIYHITTLEKFRQLGWVSFICKMSDSLKAADSLKGKARLLSQIGCFDSPKTPLQEKLLLGSDSAKQVVGRLFKDVCVEVSKSDYFGSADVSDLDNDPSLDLEGLIMALFTQINKNTLSKGAIGYEFFGNKFWIEEYDVGKGCFPAVFEWAYKEPFLFGALPAVQEVKRIQIRLEQKSKKIRTDVSLCETKIRNPFVCGEVGEDAFKAVIANEASSVKAPVKLCLEAPEVEAIKVDGVRNLSLRLYFGIGEAKVSEVVGSLVHFDLYKVEWRDDKDNVIVEAKPRK